MRKLFFIFFFLFSFNHVYAETNSFKRLMIPFSHIPISSDAYTGLSFNYNLQGKIPKKIICYLNHIHYGWLEFSAEGNLKRTEFFLHKQRILLTSKKTHKDRNIQSTYRVDPMGSVVIQNLKRTMESHSIATASCRYEIS